MFLTIPTWNVTLYRKIGEREEAVWRVPETSLPAFLEVLTFNKREFSVTRDHEADDLARASNSQPSDEGDSFASRREPRT